MNSIRRALAAVGFLGLLWLGIQLVQGSVSLADAGLRAVILLVAVGLTIRVAGAGVRLMASSLD